MVNAACDKAWFGWPIDRELERLRDAFAGADRQRKTLAEQIQVRAMETGLTFRWASTAFRSPRARTSRAS